MKKIVTIGIILICVLGITTLSYASTCNFTPKATLEEKKEILDARVAEGIITEEEANEIEEKLENCNGIKQERIGQEYGVCFGNEDATCQGKNNDGENRNGKKQRQMQGNGNGVCDGTGKGTGICKRLSE